MKKNHSPATSVTLIFILLSIMVMSGCTRNGEFSKEGAYEILKGMNNSQNTTTYDEPQEDMDFQEYERRRQSI